MHPSCALIVWLATVIATQFVGYGGLAVLFFGILLAAPMAGRPWLGYVMRARWLLLTLWLVLAYNTPGEAFEDMRWAPTYEGIADASLQAVRLLVMLAGLAWLFDRLGRQKMVGGLWGLMRPLRSAGVDVERLVVRLSLVLENLQVAPEKGAWRRMLADGARDFGDPGVLYLEQSLWTWRDSLISVLAGGGLMGVVVL